jgi:hypothetical protein
MSWFLNHYKCARCHRSWTDEWSCMCDDDCPHCGARHMSPDSSDELTELIEEEGNAFVVRWSPESAEHTPDYQELGRFQTYEKATSFLMASRHLDSSLSMPAARGIRSTIGRPSRRGGLKRKER